jgi:hypothetical protein
LLVRPNFVSCLFGGSTRCLANGGPGHKWKVRPPRALVCVQSIRNNADPRTITKARSLTHLPKHIALEVEILDHICPNSFGVLYMADASLDQLDAAIYEGTGKTPADRVPFNDKSETFKVPLPRDIRIVRALGLSFVYRSGFQFHLIRAVLKLIMQIMLTTRRRNRDTLRSPLGTARGPHKRPQHGPMIFCGFSGVPFSSRGHTFAASGVMLFAFLCVGIVDACSRKLGVRFSASRVRFA